MYFSLFYFIICFFWSMCLHATFLLDAVRHEIPFRKGICCRPVTLLWKDSLWTLYLYFHLVTSTASFWISCWGCILSFWAKLFMQVASWLLFAYTSHYCIAVCLILRTNEVTKNLGVRASIKCILTLFFLEVNWFRWTCWYIAIKMQWIYQCLRLAIFWNLKLNKTGRIEKLLNLCWIHNGRTCTFVNRPL